MHRPAAVVALNLPSFEKYEPRVKPGGLMVYNESLIPAAPVRSDIRYVPVPANDIAEALGNVRQANVVLLGAYLAATGYLALEAVETALDNHLSERQRRFWPATKRRCAAARRVLETRYGKLDTGSGSSKLDTRYCKLDCPLRGRGCCRLL